MPDERADRRAADDGRLTDAQLHGVQEVRIEALAIYGCETAGIEDRPLWDLLTLVRRDVDLAALALAQRPRPAWLVELTGEQGT